MALHVIVGKGPVGTTTARALAARGHEVRVLDDLSTGSLDNLAWVRDQVDFVRGDVAVPEDVRRAVEGVEIVYHQAALASVPRSVARIAFSFSVNANARKVDLLQRGFALLVRLCRATDQLEGATHDGDSLLLPAVGRRGPRPGDVPDLGPRGPRSRHQRPRARTHPDRLPPAEPTL